MMKNLNAWVLDLGLGYKVALGIREILHLIDAPATFTVPCTPPYCSKVVPWQGRMLPVMELASRLDGKSIAGQFIAVVGYQKVRGEYPQFGALLLTSPPTKILVNESNACELPEKMYSWRELVISCFELNGESLPVLNLNRVFMPLADNLDF